MAFEAAESRLREQQFRPLVQGAPAIIAVIEADPLVVRYVGRLLEPKLFRPPRPRGVWTDTSGALIGGANDPARFRIP
jgi:hypothetical protein